MKLAIMQPYLFPYIGYFQLINAVDEFVVYDNIKFTKKGWINRNRILVNNKDQYISAPLKKASDYLKVSERYLAETWVLERKKLLNKIEICYKKAPYFNVTFPVIEKCFLFENDNLFQFIYHSINTVKSYLDINTAITASSSIAIDHTLKGEEKVIKICVAKKAGTYINAIGGTMLYNKDTFRNAGISLSFLKTNDITYKQFSGDFIPSLSIIDVMMFNSAGEITRLLNEYKLI